LALANFSLLFHNLGKMEKYGSGSNCLKKCHKEGYMEVRLLPQNPAATNRSLGRG